MVVYNKSHFVIIIITILIIKKKIFVDRKYIHTYILYILVTVIMNGTLGLMYYCVRFERIKLLNSKYFAV